MENNNTHTMWQNIVNEIIRNRGLNINTNRTFTAPARPTNTNPTNPQGSRRIHSQYIESINDMIYEYNRNIRDYQENMRNIIHLIDNTQSIYLPNNRRSTINHRTGDTTNPFENDADILFSYRFYMNDLNANPTNPDINNTFIPLTREEIARTTRTYGFTQEDLDSIDSSGNVCPISLEPFQIGDVICEIRGCQHMFKRPMLMNWLRRSVRCPVCRYNINEYQEEEEEEEEGQEEENQVEESQVEESQVEESQVEEPNMENAISQLFQNLLNSQNTIDTSGNLLYEFELPLFHND